ncbi:MAG: aminoglycoside phosphotransferase family protein, partial [Acidimicrobiales bacterium]
LVIDPKPLVGDPAFAPAPIVRSNELGHSRQAVLRRLDAMVDALGVPGRRAAGWAIGQTVAWSIDDDGGGAYARHVDTAGWLLDRWEGRP